jgi:hypothetical protein
MINAVYYLNRKLRGLPTVAPAYTRNNKIITEHIDYDNLLLGNWKSETLWLDKHLDTIFQPINNSKTGEPNTKMLDHVVNLSLIICALSKTDIKFPQVQDWLKYVSGKLIAYLFAIEQGLHTFISGENGHQYLKYSIPFLLLERHNNIQFRLTRYLNHLTRHNQISANHHDSLLLLASLGDNNSILKMKEMFRKNLDFHKEASTFNSSQAYDLTHEILYGIILNVEKSFYDHSLDVLERLINEFMPGNIDLVAELLACYWFCGGKPNDNIVKAVRLLKDFSYNDDFACSKDTNTGSCCCLDLKEIAHHKLTTLLGLSSTLLFAGEILAENRTNLKHGDFFEEM